MTQVLEASIGVTKTKVSLLRDFETAGWKNGSEGMIFHELGHILDNRSKENSVFPAVISGGGAADKLINFVGGAPSKPVRFFGEVDPTSNLYQGNDYIDGNNSSADYYAQAFMCNVLGVNGTQWGMAERWVDIQLKFSR